MKNIIFISIAALLLIFFVSFQFLLKVKIECKSQYGVCSREIESGLAKSQNKGLFIAKKDIHKVVSENLTVSNFSVQYKLPNILLVNLIIKKPVFSVRSSRNGQIALLDLQGNVLSTTQETGLPEVQADIDIPKVGERIGDTLLFAAKLQAGIFEMYQVRVGQISENSLVVVLPSQIRVIFPLQGDSDVLLGSLRLVYSKIESGIQGGKFSEIDLRFKNPVLR